MTIINKDDYIIHIRDDKSGVESFHHTGAFYTKHCGLNIVACTGGPLVRELGDIIPIGGVPDKNQIGSKICAHSRRECTPPKNALKQAMVQIMQGTYEQPSLGYNSVGALITNKDTALLDFDKHPLARKMLNAVIRDIGHNAAVTVSIEDENGPTANRVKANTFRLLFEMDEEVRGMLLEITKQKGPYVEGVNNLFEKTIPGVDFRGASEIENKPNSYDDGDPPLAKKAPFWTYASTVGARGTHKLLDNPEVTPLPKLSDMKKTFYKFKARVNSELKERGKGTTVAVGANLEKDPKKVGGMTLEHLKAFQAEVRELYPNIDTAGPGELDNSMEIAKNIHAIWERHPTVRNEMNSMKTPDDKKYEPYYEIEDNGECFSAMTRWVPKFALNMTVSAQDFFTQANILRLSFHTCKDANFYNNMIDGRIQKNAEGEWVGCKGTKPDGETGEHKPKFRYSKGILNFLQDGKLKHMVNGREITMHIIRGVPQGMSGALNGGQRFTLGLIVPELDTCITIDTGKNGPDQLYKAIEILTQPPFPHKGEGLKLPLVLGYKVNSIDPNIRKSEKEKLHNATMNMLDNVPKADLDWSIVDPQGLNPPRTPGGRNLFNISKKPIAGEITRYGTKVLPDDHHLQNDKDFIPLHKYWAYEFFMQHAFRNGFLPLHMDDNGFTETPYDVLKKFDNGDPEDLKDIQARGITRERVEDFIAHEKAYIQVLAVLIKKHFKVGPTNLAIMFVGDKGTGKSLAVTWLICMRYECESLEILKAPGSDIDAIFGPTHRRTTSSVTQDVFNGQFNDYAKNEVTRLEEFTSLRDSENQIKDIATSPDASLHRKGENPIACANKNLITGTTNEVDNVQLKEVNRKINFFSPKDFPSEARKMIAHINREKELGNITKELWPTDIKGASDEGPGKVSMANSLLAKTVGSDLDKDIAGDDWNIAFLIKNLKHQFEAWYCHNHLLNKDLDANYSNSEGEFRIGDVHKTPYAEMIDSRGQYGAKLLRACTSASKLSDFIDKHLTDIDPGYNGTSVVVDLLTRFSECEDEIPLELLRETWEYIRQKEPKHSEVHKDRSRSTFRRMVTDNHLDDFVKTSEIVETNSNLERVVIQEWLIVKGFAEARKNKFKRINNNNNLNKGGHQTW